MVKKIDTKELKKVIEIAQVVKDLNDVKISKAVFKYIEKNYPRLLPG